MKSAVTVCLVPEARQGPFVFHDGLEAGCHEAAALGFDAVEVFPAVAADLPRESFQRLLDAHGLGLAAVGTGAGWLRHGLSFTHADAEVRGRALAFAGDIVDAAGALGAPAIIGSMQGRSSPALPRAEALERLGDALASLGSRAACHGQPLLYEPLNRYETDLLNRQADAVAFLADRGLDTVKLLCDLFHMNIEEANPAAALEGCAGRLGHVHWADSNRRALGFGHTDPVPVVAALRRIGYEGHLSAEVFPQPSSRAAAERTIASLRDAALTRPL